MLNTHTNAGRHSRRLSRQQILHGQHDATLIAGAVRYYLLQGQSNAHPSPVSNLREAAVRAILHADRALEPPRSSASYVPPATAASPSRLGVRAKGPPSARA